MDAAFMNGAGDCAKMCAAVRQMGGQNGLHAGGSKPSGLCGDVAKRSCMEVI